MKKRTGWCGVVSIGLNYCLGVALTVSVMGYLAPIAFGQEVTATEIQAMIDRQARFSARYSAEQILGLNEVLISSLRMSSTEVRGEERLRLTKLEGVSAIDAGKIMDRATDVIRSGHVVTAPLGFKGPTGMGYAFAEQSRIHSLSFGLAPDAVRTLWAIGQFKGTSASRTWYVVTMVRGLGGEWWVLDPAGSRGTPPTLEDWYERLRGVDATGTAMLFVTDSI